MAEIGAGGTIVLILRACAAGGGVGHGRLEFQPSHPNYPEVLRYLGGMKPGEIENLAPWPD